MEPSIISEDEVLLVLDKPSGITVNKADTTKGEQTIQDWLESRYHYLPTPEGMQIAPDFYNRAGIVHRLDKETSGILLVAKSPEAFVTLQSEFKERIVKKTYIALSHGQMLPEEGEIRVPVGRLSWNRKRFGIVPGGRDSITKYRTLHLYQQEGRQPEKFSLLELYPETGRTHQIRVHLKYMQHPVFADELYGGRKTARNDRKLLPRLFLHATKITFLHPATNLEVTFTSTLPTQLQALLEQFTCIV